MPADSLYFVHISDTHLGPAPDYDYTGFSAWAHVEKLVDVINNLPVPPDFVIHTGDVVHYPYPDAYRLAARCFSRLKFPIYYVNANHDHAAGIRQYLPMGPKTDLSDNPDLLAYAFDVKGYRFLTVDGRGPEEIDPHGRLSDEQLEIVRREATVEGPPLTVFIHFPVWPLDSPWMDENMLLLNGRQFHEALLPARQRLRGVFHGHVHQNMQTVRDGVTYTAVASVVRQLTAWPNEQSVNDNPDHPPGYNFVHLLPRQTIVHQHTFPRP